MNRDEIKAVYDRGPDAVIELVQRLFAIIADQHQQIVSLTQRVKELEDRLNSDSHNSNKPPSTDQFKKKPRSLRQRGKKKPGAQAGHKPHFLQQSPNPDQVIVHPVEECHSCQASLKDVDASDCFTRQVFDLPQVKVEVTEHRVEVKQCPECGQRCESLFPKQVKNLVQYGEGVKSLAVYLMNYQMLPYRRTREIMQDLLGQPLAEGTLKAALGECYDHLAETEILIKEEIGKADISHFDETGFYVKGKRQWLHVAATGFLTHYAHHPKRGSEATDEIGILPEYWGRAIHDGFKSYWSYTCEHALCNAHHLRELIFLEEELEEKWASEMKKLLIEIKESVEKNLAEGKSSLSRSEIESFEKRYERILKKGYRIESKKPALATGKRGPKKQTKGKNLLDRMSRYRKEVLSYMYDLRVPFDNNQAERDLRMMKVKQKISGCFRSEKGAKEYCRIRSYISTMRKQGHNVLTAINSVFAGHPITPALSG